MRFTEATSGKDIDSLRYWGNHPMMFGTTQPFWVYGVLWLVTWFLVIAVLVALLRWLWNKGDKEKS